MGCLYKLTSPSQKSYIGISKKGLEKRWAKHVEHALGKRDAGALYAALRKYGPENFTREVLAESDDWDELCRMEVEAIKEHNTRSPHGYNITPGGEGFVGPRDDVFKAKVSVAQKKRFERPEERERLRLAGLKGCNSEKAKAANAARRKPKEKKPKPSGPEWSKRMKEVMARPEVKKKMSEAARKRAADPAWKEKLRASSTGRKMPPRSDEWRQMVSEMRKKEWQDPVMRERRLEILAKARESRKQKLQEMNTDVTKEA